MVPDVEAHTFETYATYANKELPEHFEQLKQGELLTTGERTLPHPFAKIKGFRSYIDKTVTYSGSLYKGLAHGEGTFVDANES